MSTKVDDITITKQTGTRLTLNQQGKYVAYDGYFDIAVRTGVGTVTVASTDATIQSDASGRNISGVIGTKSQSAPSSGYYLKVDASGSAGCSVSTAGWFNTGEIGTASASGSFYFPVNTATASVSGTNTVTPTASISGSNVTLSNTNNGISVTATGGGSAAASVSDTGSQAGYAPSGATLGSGTINASSQSTTASTYLSGVTLGIPQSGTNSFAVTLPNGDNDTITLTFVVDTYGNWSVNKGGMKNG